MDLQTGISLGAAAVSVAGAGIAVWQAVSARQQARDAKRQADAADRQVALTELQMNDARGERIEAQLSTDRHAALEIWSRGTEYLYDMRVLGKIMTKPIRSIADTFDMMRNQKEFILSAAVRDGELARHLANITGDSELKALCGEVDTMLAAYEDKIFDVRRYRMSKYGSRLAFLPLSLPTEEIEVLARAEEDVREALRKLAKAVRER